MFSLICAWMNDRVNNGEAGDLRRYRTHYDVTVMVRCTGLVSLHGEMISNMRLIKRTTESNDQNAHDLAVTKLLTASNGYTNSRGEKSSVLPSLMKWIMMRETFCSLNVHPNSVQFNCKHIYMKLFPSNLIQIYTHLFSFKLSKQEVFEQTL